MRLTVNTSQFLAALKDVRRAALRRSTLPVLHNVLIEARADGLRLTCNNLEIAITSRLESYNCIEAGAITLPAHRLYEFVRRMVAGQIELIERDNAEVFVAGDMMLATLKGIYAEEFPQSRETDVEPVHLNADLLAEMIGQVAMCAARDISRPVLQGVHIRLADGKLSLETADSYRLASRSESVDADAELDAIVPAEAMGLVARTCVGNDVAITVTNEIARFETDQAIVTSQLLEGKYPDFAPIIEKAINETAKTITVGRAEVLRALRGMMVIAQESANMVKIETMGQHLKLSANATGGTSEAMLAAEIEGTIDEAANTFNGSYLATLVDGVPTDEVRIGISGNESPGRVLPVDGPELEYVLMPMHVGGR